MTPDEQRLIEDLFDRLRPQPGALKDRQADALIQRSFRDNPDAGYAVVQMAIVAEHQMAAADQRIQELEEQAAQASSSSGGSFLGSIFGGGGSVPARAPAMRDDRRDARTRDGDGPRLDDGRNAPWGNAPPPRRDYPDAPPPGASRGGGFLGSVFSTATGVAGGMLAAESLRGLFGGHGAQAGGAQAGEGSHNAGGNSPLPGPGSPASTSADKAALEDADRTQDEMQDEQIASDDESDNDDDADYDSGGDGIDV